MVSYVTDQAQVTQVRRVAGFCREQSSPNCLASEKEGFFLTLRSGLGGHVSFAPASGVQTRFRYPPHPAHHEAGGRGERGRRYKARGRLWGHLGILGGLAGTLGLKSALPTLAASGLRVRLCFGPWPHPSYCSVPLPSRNLPHTERIPAHELCNGCASACSPLSQTSPGWRLPILET